jgi:cytochrome c biogenesis factor
MSDKVLKRYGLEKIARILIIIGIILVISSWIIGVYYSGISSKGVVIFIVPFIFSCVLALLLLIIKYRYTLFEKYPYLMNLPSLFYRIKEKRNTDNKSIAFNMIFTVHALVILFIGLLSVVLTISIGSSIKSNGPSPFLYSYLIIVAILIVSVLLQYRKIYLRFSKFTS